MRQYRVWTHPSGLTEAVKHGWSWPAFFFGGFWAIAKRMTLLGIGMLLARLVIVYAIVVTQNEDNDLLFLVSGLLLDLFFGANGNSWREWYLKRRKFVLVETKVQTTVLPSVRTLFSHPLVGLRTLWHDPVWSKVIATIIVGVFGAVGVYIFRTHSTTDRADSANIAPHHFSVPTCKSATLNGHVKPNGAETFAWFEWGETPDLGSVTRQQRFTDETEYYQVLVDLKESTNYFYKAMASNINGTMESRVFSFTTARCER